MTFLPIVERELRVASRRRGTHGMRMKITAAATLAVVVCFFIGQVTPALSFGFCLFWGLSGMCMIYALAAGRLMTADCLSREKREGTLGLLFLTDLKGYDVVLGKLAATSLDGLYGLLTVFPLLAVPLLVGGMTNGELWRMALTLVNTFLFSLAVGLFVSSVSRDEQKAMGANLGLLLLLCALLPAFAGVLVLSGVIPGRLDQELFYCCPVYALWQCADGEYAKWPGQFWGSIATTFTLTLLLLLLACRVAPRSWQDKPVSPRTLRRERGRRRRWWRTGNLEKANAFRKRLLGLNAYFWLAARSYLKVLCVWTALGVVGSLWVSITLKIGHFDDATNCAMALILNGMLKLWMITEAGRQLAADKKSGAFEVLLSTPLTVRDILRGQWQALRWQFLKPVAVAVAAECALLAFVQDRSSAAEFRWFWLAGILMLLADALTVSWVAMSRSLTAKSHDRATLKTAALILVLPWALYYSALMATYLGMFLFSRQMRELHWQYMLGCWFVAGILVDLLYGLKARRRLQQNFRRLALEPSAPKRRFAWLRDLRGTPERKAELRAKYRRTAVVAAVLVAVACIFALYDLHLAHTHFPQPVIVSISQSNNPVRVIAGQEDFLFILPDGTLWRWGSPASGEGSTASPPSQVGTNRDWVQVSGRDAHILGLRSDGTIWTWAADREIPKKFGSDHDWVEVSAGDGYYFARKRDGTLWAWGNNYQNQLGNGPGPSHSEPVQVGTNRNWKAINTTDFGTLALLLDGTLWTWGNLNHVTNGVWIMTNSPIPIQFCQESNWVALSDGLKEGLRNQAGESWRPNNPLTAFPGAGLPIASIAHLLASNAATTAAGPLFTSNWIPADYEVRTNGMMWAVPAARGWQANGALLGPSHRFGERSDWVSVWGEINDQTMIAMTSDGTIWAWGLDYGKESYWVQSFAERFGVIKRVITALFEGRDPSDSVDGILDQYPSQQEPRPLFRLVTTNSTPAIPP